MNQRLANKIAIVTGAGQGIGRGIALRLAAEGAGVVVADYNNDTANETATLIEQQGGQALAHQIDLGDVAQIEPLVAQTVAVFGRVDLLVNNAGRMQTVGLLDLTPTDWDTLIAVNQRGLFFCLQAAARQMVAQATSPSAAGKIVNIASIAGRTARPMAVHYAASKAAVISITRSAAAALAAHNITVNAVAPGPTPTAMLQQMDADQSALSSSSGGSLIEQFLTTIPLGRAATPEDIAGAVAFLCSPDADYITGQTINVSGGLEMD